MIFLAPSTSFGRQLRLLFVSRLVCEPQHVRIGPPELSLSISVRISTLAGPIMYKTKEG